VRKEKDGKIVVSFDVHNEMDFREHIARWMPYFSVVSPSSYKSYICGVSAETLEKNSSKGNGEVTDGSGQT
jgi:hypothetical protein